MPDLPDINVWLALACEDHQHHLRAAGIGSVKARRNSPSAA